jgi:hypothetical protein
MVCCCSLRKLSHKLPICTPRPNSAPQRGAGVVTCDSGQREQDGIMSALGKDHRHHKGKDTIRFSVSFLHERLLLSERARAHTHTHTHTHTQTHKHTHTHSLYHEVCQSSSVCTFSHAHNFILRRPLLLSASIASGLLHRPAGGPRSPLDAQGVCVCRLHDVGTGEHDQVVYGASDGSD